VLVVLHGAGDRPEWECEWWDGALGGRAIILCLRGRAAFPRDPETGYYFPDHHFLERELVASVAALRSAHAEQIAGGPILLAGFSQGANMGALVAPRHSELFSRLILIEGGYDQWNVAAARRLASSAPARVLFACGQEYCASHARAAERWLRRGGVQTRVEHAPGVGHTYAEGVGDRVLAAFDWIVDGDPRWAE
jgi:predicted esterase